MEEICPCGCGDDKSKKIINEMNKILTEIQKSETYDKLKEKIKSHEFQRKLCAATPMVVYTLGSMEDDVCSRYQLGVAISLERDFPEWITGIEVFDPVLSHADVVALKHLGCHVLEVDEECRRQVTRPTLFFMPCANFNLLGNLLGANWCPKNISQVILLTNKLGRIRERYQKGQDVGQHYDFPDFSYDDRKSYIEALQECKQEIRSQISSGSNADNFLFDPYEISDDPLYFLSFYQYSFMDSMKNVEAIQNYTEEVDIPSFGKQFSDSMVNYAFHFFNVTPEVDMDKLIPDEKEMRRKFCRQFDKIEKLQEFQIKGIIKKVRMESDKSEKLEEYQRTVLKFSTQFDKIETLEEGERSALIDQFCMQLEQLEQLEENDLMDQLSHMNITEENILYTIGHCFKFSHDR